MINQILESIIQVIWIINSLFKSFNLGVKFLFLLLFFKLCFFKIFLFIHFFVFEILDLLGGCCFLFFSFDYNWLLQQPFSKEVNWVRWLFFIYLCKTLGNNWANIFLHDVFWFWVKHFRSCFLSVWLDRCTHIVF